MGERLSRDSLSAVEGRLSTSEAVVRGAESLFHGCLLNHSLLVLCNWWRNPEPEKSITRQFNNLPKWENRWILGEYELPLQVDTGLNDGSIVFKGSGLKVRCVIIFTRKDYLENCINGDTIDFHKNCCCCFCCTEKQKEEEEGERRLENRKSEGTEGRGEQNTRVS